jgi:hypothetical protein
MESTYRLIHSLTEPEKTLLRHSLSYIPKNNTGRENLLLKLTDFILSCKKCPSSKEALEGVYGKGESGKKIINLRKRLYARVLDLFIFDSELHRNENLTDQDLEWVKVKKKLAQFYTLHYSGRDTTISLQLLDEAIETSKEYEHYIVVVECLRFKKWLISLLEGPEFFEAIQKEISKYEFCSQVVSKAVDTVYMLDIKNVFQANPDKNRLIRLRNKINKLKQENRIAHSIMASYYISLLEIDYLMCKNNYRRARTKCLGLITFITNNKIIYRKQRLASVRCNLSRCELFLRNFKSAAEIAGLALKDFPPATTNFSIAKEQEFYARFYGGWLDLARESLCDMLSISKNEQGDFRHSKYNFFMACIHFRQHNFTEANRILNNYQDISMDQSGWDISVRILRIMCSIELGHEQQAELLIESFRKHLSKPKFDPEHKDRYKLLLSLFKRLEKQEFSFDTLPAKTSAIINRLKLRGKDQSWEFLGPELIPVHAWAEKKFKSTLAH